MSYKATDGKLEVIYEPVSYRYTIEELEKMIVDEQAKKVQEESHVVGCGQRIAKLQEMISEAGKLGIKKAEVVEAVVE